MNANSAGNGLPSHLQFRNFRKESGAQQSVDNAVSGGHDQIDWCIPPCLGSDTDKVRSGGHDQIDWCIPPCLGGDTGQAPGTGSRSANVRV